jgi:hypothetical protein
VTPTLPAEVTPARFSMLLPDTWETLDFDPVTRDRSIERLVRRAVGTADSLVLVRRWAVETYREMYRHAASTGLFFGANYAEVVGGQPLSASVLAFVTKAPRDDHEVALGVEAMAADLSEPADDDRALAAPRFVDLPVGRAVRTRARVGVHQTGSDGQEPEVDVVRYFTPVPRADHLLVIAFSTPMLAAGNAFAELFDSMAATARWRN